MKFIIAVLIIILLFNVILAYACLVVASEADEKAKRMYRAWKESVDNDKRTGTEA